MDSFSDLACSCASTRKLYSNLFRIPRSYEFANDTLLLIFDGALYSVTFSDFHLGMQKWRKIVSERPKLMSRNAQLLQERMRQSGKIKMFDVFVDEELVFLHGSSPQLQTLNGDIISTFPECEGAIGLQICPSNYQLVACVLDGDIYLLDSRTATIRQLTFTKDVPYLSAGFPPYIIQEEFDRYSGFLWQNSSRKNVARILYEEVNEEGLEVIHTFNPITQSVEDYAYPRPGKTNAKSVLKLLELRFSDEEQLSVKELSLSLPLHKLFPHCCEYLVRFGWMPGEDDVWIQLLNRQQTHLLLVVVPIDCFISEKCKEALSRIYILWEEKSSFWISISDYLEFLPVEGHSNSIRFTWLSGMSGYRHLYLVEAIPPDEQNSVGSPVPCAKFTSRAVTSGNWNILDSKVWLDSKSEKVYFEANKDSPVQKHLYVVNLLGNSEPRRLTDAGFYHDITMDTRGFRYFISVFSNESSSINVAIHTLAEPHSKISEWHGPDIPATYCPPTLFTVQTETGEELYGAIYSPENLKIGAKVPTMLYVYGGPGVQMVTCALSKQLARIQSWRKHGYAVVMLDNRGSANRGHHFESFVKGQMGQTEVQDQVLGLKAASETVDFIDLDRVGVMGWSYGGYLSLMAIAEYPSVIKVCVSGAPVTDWFYYDTAYTERYLGVPDHSADPAYIKSSVIMKASKFPSDSTRLLIIHGLDDENVLFTHSASLCNELISQRKPYVMQFYPGERHGLRSPNNIVHCDATILQFLNQNL